MALLSPFIAFAADAGRRRHHLRAARPQSARGLYVYFVEPLTTLWSIEQLIVKAAPLVLIGVGLAVCYHGQCLEHRRRGPVHRWAPSSARSFRCCFPTCSRRSTLAADAGARASSAAWPMAAIPAFLKNRFSANEILTSLMLVYVAQLILDWLVRGPWRDPQGYNFPKTMQLHRLADAAELSGAGRASIGRSVFGAVVAVVSLRLVPDGPHAEGLRDPGAGRSARGPGASPASRARKTVWFCFLLSGGARRPCRHLRGGRARSASCSRHLARLRLHRHHRRLPRPAQSARHRSSPALVLALSYLGGEAAQIALGISDKTARVFQGMLLFFVLACDTLILYRLAVHPAPRAAGWRAAHER